jgi:nucleotide-binding universal stress UspA family protein
MRTSHILVPIDFSAGSLRALDYAVDLNRVLAAELDVLLVVEAIHLANPASILGPGKNLRMLVDEQCRVGEAQLLQLKQEYEKKGVSLTTSLELGTPAMAICETARKRKVDLIVMATHGRTGLSHVILGSVSEHVVREAPCPVLTVHTYNQQTKKRSKKS